ncbi:hypothetical protein B5X24_HaOG213911 [Helicoverpa armigera]|uniref:Uncharacterized protein n=1 Tax=Helicoverpa armigera TaxID=29058 RepID=A0A2W1BEE4_HELAM|nr:hypothetical protein B5X24_HaOG213911 [Helicoverpa armigera]
MIFRDRAILVIDHHYVALQYGAVSTRAARQVATRHDTARHRAVRVRERTSADPTCRHHYQQLMSALLLLLPPAGAEHMRRTCRAHAERMPSSCAAAEHLVAK